MIRTLIETLESEPVLGPYRTFASGIGNDDSGFFMAVVLVYDTPSWAQADVPVFRQRIETGMSFRGKQP